MTLPLGALFGAAIPQPPSGGAGPSTPDVQVAEAATFRLVLAAVFSGRKDLLATQGGTHLVTTESMEEGAAPPEQPESTRHAVRDGESLGSVPPAPLPITDEASFARTDEGAIHSEAAPSRQSDEAVFSAFFAAGAGEIAGATDAIAETLPVEVRRMDSEGDDSLGLLLAAFANTTSEADATAREEPSTDLESPAGQTSSSAGPSSIDASTRDIIRVPHYTVVPPTPSVSPREQPVGEPAQVLATQAPDVDESRLRDLLGSVATPVRDMGGLRPEFRSKLERVVARMSNEFGYTVEVVETTRSQERQDTLFAQGRTEPGPVVTWTRQSRHTEGVAADVRINGGWTDAEGFATLARVAREEGLKSLWPRDPGHLELLQDHPTLGTEHTGPTAPPALSATPSIVASAAERVRRALDLLTASPQEHSSASPFSFDAKRVASSFVRPGAIERFSEELAAANGSILNVPATVNEKRAPAVNEIAVAAPMPQVAIVAEVAPVARVGTVAPVAPVAEVAAVAGVVEPGAPSLSEGKASSVDEGVNVPNAYTPRPQRLPGVAKSSTPATPSALDGSVGGKETVGEGGSRPTGLLTHRGWQGRERDAAEGSASEAQLLERPGAHAPSSVAWGVDVPAEHAPNVSGAESADVAERIARVLRVQETAAERPLSSVVLRLDHPSGGEDRVRVDLRGSSVGARIDMADAAAAERLRAHAPELAQQFASQGLETESIAIRATRSAELTTAASALAGEREGIRVGGMQNGQGTNTSSQGRDTRGDARRDWTQPEHSSSRQRRDPRGQR